MNKCNKVIVKVTEFTLNLTDSEKSALIRQQPCLRLNVLSEMVTGIFLLPLTCLVGTKCIARR